MWFIALVFAASLTFVGAQTPLREKPNIIFILGDDIGYGDFGCYGATKLKTPNIDKLASQGLRFSDAHSPAATCTPTRYAFLTGQYAFRNPLGSHILPGDAPLSIKPGTVTVPALLSHEGYRTAVIGKWHLGLGNKSAEQDWNGDIKPGPLEIGFDYGFIIPATGDRTPCVFVENHRVVGLDPKDPIHVDYKNCKLGHSNPVQGIGRIGKMTGGTSALWKDDEIADTITTKATKFIEQNKSAPFFLYFATHDIHVPRVPAAQFRGKSGAGIRGDAIEQFDWSVGEIVKTLDRLNLSENTILIVTSDNGGILDHGDSVERDGDEKSNNGHAFNGPLRGTKGSPYEGGTRVPFIVRWPAKAKPGTCDALISHVDTLATVASLLGRKLPENAGPDSFDFSKLLLGQMSDRPVRDHLVEDSQRKSIRQGQWKFIQAAAGKPGRKHKHGVNNEAQLYDLAADLGEKQNVANQFPDKTKELSELLQRVMQRERTRPN